MTLRISSAICGRSGKQSHFLITRNRSQWLPWLVVKVLNVVSLDWFVILIASCHSASGVLMLQGVHLNCAEPPLTDRAERLWWYFYYWQSVVIFPDSRGLDWRCLASRAQFRAPRIVCGCRLWFDVGTGKAGLCKCRNARDAFGTSWEHWEAIPLHNH